MPITRRDLIASSVATFTAGLAMTEISSAEPQSAFAHQQSIVSPGAPTLIVRDLARVSAYYEEGIGLSRIQGDSEVVHLGAGDRTLLVLRRRPDAQLEPNGLAGLFHTAFLLPSRAELGAWLRRTTRQRLPFDGASDHLVSEALYLSDPEGNGIEIYADRAPGSWQWNNGSVEMANRPLDADGILQAGDDLPDSAVVPLETIVGHLHLRVGGLPEAEKFYQGILGLDVTRRRDGAIFYASSGYHHHLATNTWQSRGSPRRPGTTTGLVALAFDVRDANHFNAIAERMVASGGRRGTASVSAEDPWGNDVVVNLAKS